MDILLPGYSKVYITLALGYMLVDQNILRRIMRPDRWLMLRVPAIVLHELAHYIVALLLLAGPRISFKWKQDVSGVVEMGRVTYGTPLLGGFGHTLISVAPLLLYYVAWWVARTILSQPQPVLEGLAWLVAVYLCINAAAMFSRSDLADVGPIGRLMILLMILQILAEPAIRMIGLAYVALGRPDWLTELLGRAAIGV